MNEIKVYSFLDRDYVATKFSIEETIELFNKGMNTENTIDDVREVDLDNEYMSIAVAEGERKVVTFREAIKMNGEFERPYLIASTYFYK